MSDLLQTLQEIDELKKLLTVHSDVTKGIPSVRTIYNIPEFLSWKEKALLQLRSLKPEPLINETITLLTDGFKTGWNDERNFKELQSKMAVIVDNIDLFLPTVESGESVASEKLKKGTVVKTAFDQYTLLMQVGAGGNGRVFSASNGTDEQFAIKFLERNISSDKLKRFKNEIAFCEQHKHKNIVPILDRGYAYLDEKDYVFYVMPLFDATLKSKIKEGIAPDDAVNIFTGILEGLKYAHDHHAIHRDIKPENILFAAGSNEPVICDFGIAHFAEEDLLTAIETKPGDRMANFYYAAPEQYKRDVVTTPQTDVYSAALILNEMFTGEIPQAAGHKRIADIYSDYKYLDDLFDLLFKQEPNDRLYPEDAILSELRVLAVQNKRNQEAERLKTIINELVEPEEFNPKLINLEFINNGVHFVFDTALPADWFQMLVYGSYDHSWMMGYDSNKLKKIDKNTISMPVRGSESKETITKLVENVKNWVATVSRKYSQEAKRQAIAEQRKKEEARIAEIKRLEKENEINVTLNAVLKDLL